MGVFYGFTLIFLVLILRSRFTSLVNVSSIWIEPTIMAAVPFDNGVQPHQVLVLGHFNSSCHFPVDCKLHLGTQLVFITLAHELGLRF